MCPSKASDLGALVSQSFGERSPRITSHQKLAFNFRGHGQSLLTRSLVSRRGVAEETVHDTGLRGIQRNPILGGILER